MLVHTKNDNYIRTAVTVYSKEKNTQTYSRIKMLLLNVVKFLTDKLSVKIRVFKHNTVAAEQESESSKLLKMTESCRCEFITLTAKLHLPPRTASSSVCHWCGRLDSGTYTSFFRRKLCRSLFIASLPPAHNQTERDVQVYI